MTASRFFTLAALVATMLTANAPADAATITLGPRTDCKKTFVMNHFGLDIYEAYCHFAGTVAFSNPSNELEIVECWIGDWSNFYYGGFQGGEWNNSGGEGVYGYSQCCDYGKQQTWGNFFNTKDIAFMVDNLQNFIAVAEDTAPWLPGATL